MATPLQTTGNSLGGTITGVANLAGLFLGSESTTTDSGGTTVTTQEDSVSQAAVDSLVNSILSGTNGLAAVAGGQRQAGLYNSSTNTMLVNDLIARSAAEGAKLNKKTTQTTTAPATTKTTATPAKISPTKTAVGLAALQLIPKDIKAAMLSGLGIKTAKTAADAASMEESGIKISEPSGNGDFGYDKTTGAPIGTDGLGAQSIGGLSLADSESASTLDFGPSLVQDNESFISSLQDYADVTETDFSSASDIFDIGSDFIDTDTVESITDLAAETDFSDAADIFDDFSYDFADGGLVSKKGYKEAVGKHAAGKMVRKGYADGGLISKLSTGGYQANTGLRRVSDGISIGQAAGVGAQSVGQALGKQVAMSAPARVTGTSSTSAANKGATMSDSGDTSSDGTSQNTSSGPNGLAAALGISSGQARVGMSALGMATGIPLGSLGGLVNAKDNAQAVKSVGMSMLGLMNPGLAIGAMVADKLGLFGGGSGDAGATTQTEEGGMSVMGSGGPMSSTADTQSLGTDPLGGTSPSESESSADGTSSSGGADNGSTGAGSSSGSSVGGNYKSGGEINGPGTGTSDSIPVNLSDGEYVLPADVVKALGVDTLDSIVSRIHKPAKARK